MIFGKDQVAQIRGGKITATVVPASLKAPKANMVQHLYRRSAEHDENGEPTGRMITSRVEDGTLDARYRVVLTILSVTENVAVDQVDQVTARACGYKTKQGLLDYWRTVHPRTPAVHVVWFTLGDVRDRDQFLAFGGLAGGDYTLSPSRALDSDAPVVRPELARITKQARERDASRAKEPVYRRRADLARALAALEDAERGAPAQTARRIRAIRRHLHTVDRELKEAA